MPAQESIENDPGPSALTRNAIVSITSGNSIPPSLFQIPRRMCTLRIAVVINIGVTAIAAYIGAGGLGTFISRGISQTDVRQLITGALTLGLLAIACDYALLLLQRRLTPKGALPRAASR